MIGIGDKLPAFKLLNHDGDPITHTDLHGARTLIFAFPRAATPG